MVGCDSENGCQKDTCSKEIGMHAFRNLLSILDAIVNIIEELLGSFDNLENLHFDNEYNVHRSSENHEGSGYGHHLDLLIISTFCLILR